MIVLGPYTQVVLNKYLFMINFTVHKIPSLNLYNPITKKITCFKQL